MDILNKDILDSAARASFDKLQAGLSPTAFHALSASEWEIAREMFETGFFAGAGFGVDLAGRVMKGS